MTLKFLTLTLEDLELEFFKTRDGGCIPKGGTLDMLHLKFCDLLYSSLGFLLFEPLERVSIPVPPSSGL